MREGLTYLLRATRCQKTQRWPPNVKADFRGLDRLFCAAINSRYSPERALSLAWLAYFFTAAKNGALELVGVTLPPRISSNGTALP